jgi:hypothetical protein
MISLNPGDCNMIKIQNDPDVKRELILVGSVMFIIALMMLQI